MGRGASVGAGGSGWHSFAANGATGAGFGARGEGNSALSGGRTMAMNSAQSRATLFGHDGFGTTAFGSRGFGANGNGNWGGNRGGGFGFGGAGYGRGGRGWGNFGGCWGCGWGGFGFGWGLGGWGWGWGFGWPWVGFYGDPFWYDPFWFDNPWYWPEPDVYYGPDADYYPPEGPADLGAPADNVAPQDQDNEAPQDNVAPPGANDSVQPEQPQQNDSGALPDQSNSSEAASAASEIVLYLDNGQAFAVSDYWFSKGQLYFDMDNGAEVGIDASRLDVQRTTDENARRGLQFEMKTSPAHPAAPIEPASGAAGRV